MGEDVLKSIGELERVDVPQPELDVRVDDQLGESKDFTTQVEGVPESRLFAFFGR
jgi:hypothetical protein